MDKILTDKIAVIATETTIGGTDATVKMGSMATFIRQPTIRATRTVFTLDPTMGNEAKTTVRSDLTFIGMGMAVTAAMVITADMVGTSPNRHIAKGFSADMTRGIVAMADPTIAGVATPDDSHSPGN